METGMRHPKSNTGREVVTDMLFSLPFPNTWSSCYNIKDEISQWSKHKGYLLAELLCSSCSPTPDETKWHTLIWVGQALSPLQRQAGLACSWESLFIRKKQQLPFKTQLSQFQQSPGTCGNEAVMEEPGSSSQKSTDSSVPAWLWGAWCCCSSFY